MIKIGDINVLKVLRETDIGYMLDSKEGEIFLHKNESEFQNLKAGDQVSAFLYFDQKQRLAATLKTPLVTTQTANFLEVTDVLDNLGVFLNMGISKELLLSKDDLPYNKNEWPRRGDKVYVKVLVKKRLVARLIDVAELPLKETLTIGEEKDFYVQKVGSQGLNLLNEDLEKVFVHHSMLRGSYRLGEKTTARITNLNERGYLGSLLKQKEELRFDDAEIIMQYLTRYKKMSLTSKSSAEEVSKVFDMSKKAFKRALGLLYKERKIDFIENETILIDGDKNE